MTAVHVGALLTKPEGTRERHQVSAPVQLEKSDGISILGPVSFDVQLMKLPHEINVHVSNLKGKGFGSCSRCLKEVSIPIEIPFFEREFIIDLDERNLVPGEEVFYVDKGRSVIDMEAMLREEILLHFPTISLCSDGCKGLCDGCGINLNEAACSCKSRKSERISPFKGLSQST